VLEVLTPADCMRRLAANHLGRLAVVTDGRPIMFPVNYALDDGDVVFRPDPGTKLHAAEGREVAFEIDGIDSRYHEGCSVLVGGTANEERDPARRRELAALPLRPWTAGAKDHWVRIRASVISGRRIVHEETGVDPS